VISGLIVGYGIALRFILDLALWAQQTFGKVFLHENFAKIAAQFFTEAAVLIFVFPILDRIVEDKPVTTDWVLISIGLSLLFLSLAGILSRGS